MTYEEKAMTHIGPPNRASKPDRKLKFSTFENPRWRSLTDEHLTEQHWQPVFLSSKPSVSIHVCCSYIELWRWKLHKSGHLQVGNWHVNYQYSSYYYCVQSAETYTEPSQQSSGRGKQTYTGQTLRVKLLRRLRSYRRAVQPGQRVPAADTDQHHQTQRTTQRSAAVRVRPDAGALPFPASSSTDPSTLRVGSAVGRWTCDWQVAGSTPGRSAFM